MIRKFLIKRLDVGYDLIFFKSRFYMGNILPIVMCKIFKEYIASGFFVYMLYKRQKTCRDSFIQINTDFFILRKHG